MPAGSLGGGCPLEFQALSWFSIIPAGVRQDLPLSLTFDMPSVLEDAVEERLGEIVVVEHGTHCRRGLLVVKMVGRRRR